MGMMLRRYHDPLPEPEAAGPEVPAEVKPTDEEQRVIAALDALDKARAESEDANTAHLADEGDEKLTLEADRLAIIARQAQIELEEAEAAWDLAKSNLPAPLQQAAEEQNEQTPDEHAAGSQRAIEEQGNEQVAADTQNLNGGVPDDEAAKAKAEADEKFAKLDRPAKTASTQLWVDFAEADPDKATNGLDLTARPGLRDVIAQHYLGAPEAK